MHRLRGQPRFLGGADVRGDPLEVVFDRLKRERFAAVSARFRQIEIGQPLDLRVRGGVLVFGARKVELGVR